MTYACDGDALHAYHDGELAPQDGARVADHLRDCTRCRGALEELRATSRRFAPTRARRAPEALRQRVLQQAPAALARSTWREHARRAAAVIAGASLYLAATWATGARRAAPAAPELERVLAAVPSVSRPVLAGHLRDALPYLAGPGWPSSAQGVLEQPPEARLLATLFENKENR